MTPFTDDDLKRLKKEIKANKDYPDNGDLLALLARLEAAEAIAGYICHCDQNTIDLSQDCPCPKLHEEWRKAAGKP